MRCLPCGTRIQRYVIKKCPSESRKYAESARVPCLFLQLQWHCVVALSQTIFVPFDLIVCCFVGIGCLMLNADQITKALFWSCSTVRRAWKDKGSMDGKCFHRAWLFDSSPPLCLRAKFTPPDGVSRSPLSVAPIWETSLFAFFFYTWTDANRTLRAGDNIVNNLNYLHLFLICKIQTHCNKMKHHSRISFLLPLDGFLVIAPVIYSLGQREDSLQTPKGRMTQSFKETEIERTIHLLRPHLNPPSLLGPDKHWAY